MPTGKLSGPRSRYRGKVRRPIVVTFTPEGHAALAEGTRRTGLSRADYIESLLRRARGPLRLDDAVAE